MAPYLSLGASKSMVLLLSRFWVLKPVRRDLHRPLMERKGGRWKMGWTLLAMSGDWVWE